MNNKEIDSNILLQDISLDGLDFPPGYSVNTENLKLVNGKKEGKVKVLSSKKLILALLQFHADMLEGFCVFKNEQGQKIKECVYEKGKMNGYICEYENRCVVYTGMCRDDKKYSELKEYEGNDEYLEEVKDGKRIGIWKFSNDTFEEGICYEIDNDTIISVFQYKCGEEKKIMYEFENGQMIEYDKNGRIVYIGEYEGDFKNGFTRKNNEKKLYDEINKRIVYKGDYDENTYERKGDGWRYEYEGDQLKSVFICKDGQDVYQWITIIDNDKMIEYDKNGLRIYEGEYDKNCFTKNGEGELYVDNDCLVYSGGWKNGKKDGFGILYEEGCPSYEGEWKDDKKNGKGIEFDEDENLVFYGEWKDDKPNGNGKYYEKKKVKYEGEWKNGRMRVDENTEYGYANKMVVKLVRISISTGDELMSLLNDEEKRLSVNELVIEEGCGNELKIDLKICGFESLKKLIVKKNSLKNLNSLVISNNEELERIEIEDGQSSIFSQKTYYAPFENVKSVEITSIF